MPSSGGFKELVDLPLNPVLGVNQFSNLAAETLNFFAVHPNFFDSIGLGDEQTELVEALADSSQPVFLFRDEFLEQSDGFHSH